MPRLSVYFIRTALIYMILGFTFGGLILANKGIPFMPLAWVLLPIHIDMMFTGWLIQLAMGTAYWILPRFSNGAPRGPEWVCWLAYFSINGGIILVMVHTFMGLEWVLLTGKGMAILGILAFIAGNWKRIKPSGA